MPQREEDEAIIRMILSGEPGLVNKALTELMGRNMGRVEKIVRIGGQHQEHDALSIANDAALDVMALVQQGKFDPEKGELNALFYRIARNKWLDELDHRLRRSKYEAVFDENLTYSHPKPFSPVEDQLFLEERRALVRQALLKLGPSCFDVMYKLYFEGVKLKQLTTELNASEDALKQRHKRCKEKMKQFIQQDPRKA